MKKQLKSFLWIYLGFTRKEQNGIYVLLLILCVLVGIRFYHNTRPLYSYPLSKDFKKQLDDWQKAIVIKETSAYKKNPVHKQATASYTTFDPNTSSREELIKAGFKEWMADRILKYRQKGGKYIVPEDLKKMYGMSPSFYEKIAPFISIQKRDSVFSYKKPEKNAYIFKKIELNTADSTLLEKLPGIGPGFASRIIRYRNALGGFAHKKQLLEVFGFRNGMLDTLEEKMEIDVALIEQIPINSCNEQTLYAHPYIRKKAKILIGYRNQHGPFLSIDDLYAIKIFLPEEIEKIRPYLAF